MNRHQRRATAAKNRKAHDDYYNSYIRHLPTLPVDAPPEPGRVYHLCIIHDDWCRFYETNCVADCNCNPDVVRHVEPRRS